MKFTLTLPVKPFGVNQYFGNPDPKYKELGLPGHNGMDFRATHGQPIYASHDGIASYQVDDKGGHGVVLRTKEKYEFEGVEVYFKTIYWHMVDSDKEPGYKSPIEGVGEVEVKRGDIIGYADNTGFSSGDHLHFGLKPVAKGESDWVWYNTKQNNGYLGAIDPLPYFIDWPFQFKKDLEFGMTDPDVLKLQKFLNKNGFLVAAHGMGAPGNETDYFGKLTKEAVKKLQKAWGIFPAFGYFGEKTRRIVNTVALAQPDF